MLGGVEIAESDQGLEGHSDADVLSHAIADALLGAAGLGDLGTVLGRDQPQWADASSLDILRLVAGMLEFEHFQVVNVDAVVIAERPALTPHRAQIAAGIADALDLDPSLVSVKATTTDGMGFTGRGEGIAAVATALLESRFAPS